MADPAEVYIFGRLLVKDSELSVDDSPGREMNDEYADFVERAMLSELDPIVGWVPVGEFALEIEGSFCELIETFEDTLDIVTGTELESAADSTEVVKAPSVFEVASGDHNDDLSADEKAFRLSLTAFVAYDTKFDGK